MNELINYNNIF